MGQQQLLLIILSVLIVAVAIAVGITIYNTWSVKSNKDGLINDLNEISSLAYGYYSRAQIMGGGNGTYVGFDVNVDIKSNANGDVTWVVGGSGKSITFTATSRYGFGTVQTVMDDKGILTNFVFSGEF
ncbi:MAG: hypothetical protein HYZ34_11385 [Ignavibacteriae bacterium]|nr:hypothetical protein [Ignavibacteriota bacterium]